MPKGMGSNLGALRAETVKRLSQRVEAKSHAIPDRPLKEKVEPQKHRIGKVALTTYVPPMVRKQLKALAVDLERDMDDVLMEALNLVFALHGRAEIAPRKAKPIPPSL